MLASPTRNGVEGIKRLTWRQCPCLGVIFVRRSLNSNCMRHTSSGGERGQRRPAGGRVLLFVISVALRSVDWL